MKGTKAGFGLHDLLDTKYSLVFETTAREYVRSAWYTIYLILNVLCA